MSETAQATLVEDEAIARLKSAFETEQVPGVVKKGWPAIYSRDNTLWPLVCIAPAISQPAYHSSNVTLEDSTSFHIQIIDVEGDEPETLSDRMKTYLLIARRALFKPVTPQGEPDRFAKWGTLLTSTPTEGREARFIEPEPGQPYAGLSIVLTTNFSQNL
ncbi:hypothetical protein [Arsukibacterium indicum]|uniref:Tail terminator n=1 Tax=Arsukibacterium indicum TaxID=2848612 RepID=A0ABS6MGI9_9GAMM|nr:hypothetical protein [Arsukibacterium indicum]MBV2127923.1 hypothetical protein [Arsukibacterium indicum]